MYDYRADIQGILDHVTEQPATQAIGLYAIHAITNIALNKQPETTSKPQVITDHLASIQHHNYQVPYNDNFRKNLREILNANNCSVNHFADALNVSKSAIYRILNNHDLQKSLKKSRKYNPQNYQKHLRKVDEIVNALGFDKDWLLKGEGQQPDSLIIPQLNTMFN